MKGNLFCLIFLLSLLATSFISIPIIIKASSDGNPPLVLDEDAITSFFTTSGGSGSGSWQVIRSDDSSTKYSGQNSLKLNVTTGGTYLQPIVTHTYGANQNWSMFLGNFFYWYGLNTGKTFRWYLRDGNIQSKYYTWTDNFDGWQLINITWGDTSPCNLAIIKTVYIQFPYNYGNKVWYFDKVGLWGGPTGTTPPINGPWFPINSVIEDEDLLLNGSILLTHSDMTFKNTIVRFNLASAGQFGFGTAFEGENVTLRFVNSIVKSQNNAYRYTFSLPNTLPIQNNLYINQSSVFYNFTSLSASGIISVNNTQFHYGTDGFSISNLMKANNVNMSFVNIAFTVTSTGRAEFDGLRIWNVSDGVRFRGDDSHIYNSEIWNFADHAISCDGTSGKGRYNISWNITAWNGHEAFRSGNLNPNNNIYRNCTAYDCDWGFVFQHSASDETVIGGEVYGHLYQGIIVEMTPKNIYFNGTIIRNNPTGANIRGNSLNTTLEAVSVYDNTNQGLQFVENASATILDIYTTDIIILGLANITHRWRATGFDGYIRLFKKVGMNIGVFIRDEPDRPSFSSNVLTFYPFNNTGQAEFWVYTGILGQPQDVKENGTSISFTYDSPTKFAKFNVTFSSVTRKIEVEWTAGNNAPTIGEFRAPSMVYANKYFYLNATIQDLDRVAQFVNANVEISNSIVLKWVNSTNTFSEQSDPNGYCTIDASGSIRTTVSSTAYKLSWKIKLVWAYPEGSVSVIPTNTKVFDDQGASGSNSRTGLFIFEDDLIVSSASVDEATINPNDYIIFTGTLHYEGTSVAPEDVSGITAKVELNAMPRGSTTSIDSNGAFSISVAGESSEGSYPYIIYSVTDQNSVANKTVTVQIQRGGEGDEGGIVVTPEIPEVPTPPAPVMVSPDILTLGLIIIVIIVGGFFLHREASKRC